MTKQRNPTRRNEPPSTLPDPRDDPRQRWTESRVPTAAAQGIEQVGTEPPLHEVLRKSVATASTKKGPSR
jgi:hypothetical protein